LPEVVSGRRKELIKGNEELEKMMNSKREVIIYGGKLYSPNVDERQK